MAYCSNFSNQKIKVALIKNPCRYHKVESQEYDAGKLAPHNLCLDAFYTAYPYCLALLYGAKFNDKDDFIRIKCPHPENSIVMEIKSYNVFPRFIIKLKEKLIKFCQKIDYPIEYPHKKIIIKVIENKNCPAGYKIGEEFEFNIRRKDELCPAGFSAIFPFLSSEGKIKIHCPDPRGIIYEKDEMPAQHKKNRHSH